MCELGVTLLPRVVERRGYPHGPRMLSQDRKGPGWTVKEKLSYLKVVAS